MNDGILSQEEIDALLKMDNNSPTNEPIKIPEAINDFEKDAVGEIGNISMGTSATTLSTLLGKRVSITTPSVKITSRNQLQADYPRPYVVIEVGYTKGINGSNILIVSENDACVIADLMMGGDGHCQDTKLDELKLSAISEAMNQMIGSSTTSLSSMFNRRIDIAPPVLQVVDLSKENLDLNTGYENIVQIKFKMVIEGLVDSEIMQILPVESVKDMVGLLMENTWESVAPDENHSSSSAVKTFDNTNITEDHPPQPEPVTSKQAETRSALEFSAPKPPKSEPLSVQPVQFANLQETETDYSGFTHNINLIMDVPLDVTVELGKTRKSIKEVLELSQGSIIQLDKMAGEPVDLLVNGKLIAKGEVVVIDENYGIRVTTILSPVDRMNKLQ